MPHIAAINQGMNGLDLSLLQYLTVPRLSAEKIQP